MSQYYRFPFVGPLVALWMSNPDHWDGHADFREAGIRFQKARNEMIDLLSAQGKYDADWAALPVNADGTAMDYDPGTDEPHVREIAVSFKAIGNGSSIGNDTVEDIRFHVNALKTKHPDHPLAKHWRVLHDACYPFRPDVPVWAEFE